VALLNVAQASSDIALSSVGPFIIPLAQGQQAEFVLRVTNYGPDALPSVTIASLIPSFIIDWYPVTMPAQSDCGALIPWFPFFPAGPLSGYHFTTGPLAVGQHQDCRLLLRRASTTTSDWGYGWQTDGQNDPVQTNNGVGFVFGSLTDIGIRVEPVSFALNSTGFADSVVRLTAINHGPTDVLQFQVGACTDNFFPDFSIDGNFPGGCGPADFGPICFDSGFGFVRPALAVGQSHSCLLRLHSNARYSLPLSYPLDLIDFSLERSDHGGLIDTNFSNNTADLRLGPLPIVSVDALSLTGRLIFIAVLIVVAMGRMRWRTR
jgi:hypothetical protein